RDVGQEPGSLPLLEFCLTQLWERQEFRRISHAAYTAIGGVQQALANHADAVYAEFTKQEREQLRHIFLKLVRPGQGTEDTRQVASVGQIAEEYRGLITRLADKRLLVTGRDEERGEETVEVVHEALIRRWQTLRQWVDEEREFLVWQEKLRVLLGQWEESGKDEGALLRGLPLDEALKWRRSHPGYLGERVLNFIEESRLSRQKELKEREEQRNKNIVIVKKLASQIRHPITSIGRTARLLSRKSTDPQQLKFLDMMAMEVTRIEQTLEDLFIFVDATPLKKERSLIYPLTIKTLMLFYRTMEKQDIKHHTVVPEKLAWNVDPLHMRRIFIHLLRNAIEAMENGGELTVEIVEEADQIHIYVRDTGIGIASSDLQRVLKPFYSTKNAGIGTGLAIIKRTVSDHNGKLFIRNRENGGTEVEIILPE
ncbi:MAG: GHKL domain-containing protein, partial [Candidatus Electrothrix sp. LOE1_4_5]|nr:GHKL domain-containing protein [Candidatus Electrothrix gigas]